MALWDEYGVVHKKHFYAGVVRVLPTLLDYMSLLRDRAVCERVLEHWAAEPTVDRSGIVRRTIERQLANSDGEEADIAKRSDAAFLLLGNGTPEFRTEAEEQLRRVAADRAALEARRVTLQQRLADSPPLRDRRGEADELAALRNEAATWDLACLQLDASGRYLDGSWRRFLEKWVAALGPLVVERDTDEKLRSLRLRWPLVAPCGDTNGFKFDQLAN